LGWTHQEKAGATARGDNPSASPALVPAPRGLAPSGGNPSTQKQSMSTPMPTSSDDLSNYLPDPSTAEAATDEAANFHKEISRPDLVQRLARLRTDPDLGRAGAAAAEQGKEYVPPTAAPEMNDPTLPHARVKVAAGAGVKRQEELPTMPSLKRLEGEQ